EIVISKRDTLGVRIDQSGKFSAMTFLRAMNPEYGSSAALIKLFYKTATIKCNKDEAVAQLNGKYAADDIIYPPKHEKSGEIIVELGHQITKATAEEIRNSTLKTCEIIE